MNASDRRPLILASASPRRRELLATLHVPFTVVIAGVTELEDPDTAPRALVEHNAALKAEWVAERNPAACVLGADTTVYLEGKVLNKPLDFEEARSMLRRLSGKTHVVYTALALRGDSFGVRLEATTATEVTFLDFGEDVITEYFQKINPLDKAGGYSIQDERQLIVAGWRGSFSNIMGLPLETAKQILTQGGLLE